MPAATEDVRNGRKAYLTGTDSSFISSLQRFWQKSYAGDYFGFILLLAAYTVMKSFDEPFHQMFTLNDTRIQHPHADVERVGVFWLFIYAAGVPLVVLVLWTMAFRPDLQKAHVTILGLAITIILTSFITDVLKDAIGRPRPDLIARCKPSPSAPRDELVTIDVCTETDHHLLHDGWRSFPSGHSSFSFAGLGWVALFFASQTHVFRPRANLIVVLLCLAPLLGATMIAVSRLEDYRHDVGDVLAGSALGFAVSLFNWRRYYPSLLAKGCEEPYSLQAGNGRSGSNAGFQRVRDEEEVGDGEVYSAVDDGRDGQR